MRLAILADIHGNVLALEAVMAQLREDAPDLVVNLGDCLSGPLWPRETAEILLAQSWPTVRGNCDRYLVEQTPAEMGASDRYAHEHLTDDHRAWLRKLPPTQMVDDVLLLHARPDADDAYLFENLDSGGASLARPDEIERRLRGARASLILSGHSHVARIAVLPGGATVVNPGSVGLPGYDHDAPSPHVMESGSPHARYAVATRASGNWSVDFRTVSYDWDRAAAKARREGRDDLARPLATGYSR